MAANEEFDEDSFLLDEIEDLKSHDLHDDDDDFIHAKKSEEGEGPWLISYADLMTLLMGFFALIASTSSFDQEKVEKVKQSAAEQFGGEYVEPYKDLTEEIQAAIDKANAQGKATVTRGVDGVSIKFQGTSLFDSGAFVIRHDGAYTINSIIQQIRPQMNNYQITVEGHTDNVPITHPIIASNWELSAIRAARVAQFFERYGFQKDQLIVQGWGETRPEVPNVNEAGVAIPENQALNRRVIIKIANRDLSSVKTLPVQQMLPASQQQPGAQGDQYQQQNQPQQQIPSQPAVNDSQQIRPSIPSEQVAPPQGRQHYQQPNNNYYKQQQQQQQRSQVQSNQAD